MKNLFNFFYKGSAMGSKYCSKKKCPAYARKIEQINKLEKDSVGYSKHFEN